MFAMSWIRANPEQFDAGLVRRGLEPQAAAVLQVDARRRKCLTDLQAAQTERNTTSRDIGARKAAGEDVADLVRQVGDLKRSISELQTRADQLDAEVQTMLSELPNLPAPDVPDGPDERANQELRQWGEPPGFTFEARDHVTLGEALGLMDFAAAAKLSVSRRLSNGSATSSSSRQSRFVWLLLSLTWYAVSKPCSRGCRSAVLPRCHFPQSAVR